MSEPTTETQSARCEHNWGIYHTDRCQNEATTTRRYRKPYARQVSAVALCEDCALDFDNNVTYKSRKRGKK